MSQITTDAPAPVFRAPELVKSGQRTLQILEILARSTGSLTFSEIRTELGGIPKSSVHGLLVTLVATDWVQTDERSGRYSVGPASLRVGAAYLDGDPVVQAASPLLAHLRNQLDETVHLARLDGTDVVYLVSQESTHHLRSVSRIGRRQPAHATSLGQVLLAQRELQEVDALLPAELPALTSETITDRAALVDGLSVVRQRGWAYEQGQNTPGLGCIAVVIPGTHPARDAISCAAPLNRLNEARIDEIVGALISCAGEIGEATALRRR